MNHLMHWVTDCLQEHDESKIIQWGCRRQCGVSKRGKFNQRALPCVFASFGSICVSPHASNAACAQLGTHVDGETRDAP
eukprot:4009220-Amphidinium_carterae.1